ncbi:hypothetical protein L2E82_49431 [Cichorium intybus]|uniref:Uncharacterized protein n=1 Tax=Cichorium intybus TaxID=13427 RepID=A0ACB8Z1H7_CICIN|nr:hypothetical protein L2E82_49431 [Cichorium intybus]
MGQPRNQETKFMAIFPVGLSCGSSTLIKLNICTLLWTPISVDFVFFSRNKIQVTKCCLNTAKSLCSVSFNFCPDPQEGRNWSWQWYRWSKPHGQT